MPSQLVAIQAFDANGSPDAGARFNTWRAGTTTRTPVYADEALTAPLPNPVAANGAGVLSAWMDASVVYKFNLTSADGGVELIGAIDDYRPDEQAILTVIGRSVLRQTALISQAVADTQSAAAAADDSAQAAAASEQSAAEDAASAAADAQTALTARETAVSSAGGASASAAAAEQRASEAAADAADAASSAQASSNSAQSAADDAAETTLLQATAAAAALQVLQSFIPGRFSSAADAAAQPNAFVNAFYVGTDDGLYQLISIDPPESQFVGSGLTPGQSADLARVPELIALAEGADAIQARLYGGAASTGSGGAYALASPTGKEAAALAPGLTVSFIANHANPGASFLDLDGLGQRPLRKYGATALRAGDILGGQAATARYDGEAWQLTTPAATPSLRALAALGGGAGQLPFFTSADQMALTALSGLGRSLIGASNEGAARNLLNLGALATRNTVSPAQFSGALPLNKGGTGATSASAARSALGALGVTSASLNSASNGHIEFTNGLIVNWGTFTPLGTRFTTRSFQRSHSIFSVPIVDGGKVTNDRFPNPPFVTDAQRANFTVYNPINEPIPCRFISIGV